MKDLRDYVFESLTGAHQMHLYLSKVLNAIDGVEWNDEIINIAKDAVGNIVDLVDFDKNDFISRNCKLIDQTKPAIGFTEYRTTKKEVESFKFDRKISDILNRNGLELECCKYYVVLGVKNK